MRETKQQLAARIQADNVKAAKVATGTIKSDFMGDWVLLGKLDSEIQGWDLYSVRHPQGFLTNSTSAVIARW